MIRIRLYDQPFAAAAPREFETHNLAEWLLAHYGATPSVTVQIFKGEPSAETEISQDANAILEAGPGEYVILQSPGGGWVIFAVIMAVVAVAAVLLMPKPVMPGNINRTQQSPNNKLGNRENQVRIGERVEDIYGTVKSIPSLMMPTYVKYADHQKFEYGYYCVGRGYYDIAELRDGDTLIEDINGASAAVYNPFTSPNSGHAPVQQIGAAIVDNVVTAARAIEVDGITLKAPNQLGISGAKRYTMTPDVAGDIITQMEKSPNFTSIAEPGDTVIVSTEPFYSKVYEGRDYDGSIIEGDVVSGPHSFDGTYTIATVSDGEIRLTTNTFPVEATIMCDVDIGGDAGFTDWITLPQPDRTEVWMNVVAPNGIYLDNGGKSNVTVNYEAQIERLDGAMAPTGQVETVTGTMTGRVSDERAETIEHVTAWTGPARVRMRRTSDHDYVSDGVVQDEIKWADLYSVSPVSKADFGNKTTIHTITQATPRATAVKTRQLNCIASRKLPTYDGSAISGWFDADGRHVSGTITATSRIVDIIIAVSVDTKIGARDIVNEVDYPQMWAVQQQLDAWHPEAGQFNFTFDSDNTSFEETVITIANAAFCVAYRQNGKIRLAFDRAQTASSALFTHRNKKPNAETITRKFASDAEYDGVEFVYVDPDSNHSETITLPLDGSHTKAKKFEIAGIRSFAQAWLRANREYQKLLGQRITIETEVTMDARSLLPNARIDIVDNTRFKSFDGEVVGQSGLTLTLSQDVAFLPDLPHSIVLMRRDGSLQSIACTAGVHPNQVVLAALPSEAIVTTHGPDGIRTIYSFAADSARAAQAYLVQEIDISDGQFAKISAVNYSPSYYQHDDQPIPAKASIIN